MPHLKDQKTLPYPVGKVFDTALDLEQYPRILPYIKSVRILSKSQDRMVGSLTLGLSFIAFTYRCDIRYKKNELIEVTSDEPLFRKFASRCTFEKADEGRTIIIYELDAQFVNPILEFLAGAAMPYQARTTLHAFERYLSRV
jgi:ribosome-associated toxin RatA of RatAB toxin-antitoxin module